MDLPLHFKQFLQKSRHSVTCKLATLIWSSHSFTHQQIRVRLVSLTHQPHTACIRPSYFYARQKFGSSISAGSFIALIFQRNAVGSRINAPLWRSRHVLDAMFFTRGHKFLSFVPSLPQLFFCHANIRESRRLFYVCVGLIFFESQNKQHAYLLHVQKMQNVCFNWPILKHITECDFEKFCIFLIP